MRKNPNALNPSAARLEFPRMDNNFIVSITGTTNNFSPYTQNRVDCIGISPRSSIFTRAPFPWPCSLSSNATPKLKSVYLIPRPYFQISAIDSTYPRSPNRLASAAALEHVAPKLPVCSWGLVYLEGEGKDEEPLQWGSPKARNRATLP